MNKYLEKIAREYTQQENVETGAGDKIGLGITSAVSAGIVSKKIAPFVAKPVSAFISKGTPRIPTDALDAITDKVLSATNSTMNPFELSKHMPSNLLIGAAGQMKPGVYTPDEMNKIRWTADKAEKLKDIFMGAPARLVGINLPKYTGALSSREPFIKNYIADSRPISLAAIAGDFLGQLGGQPVKSTVNTDSLAQHLGHATDLSKGATKLKSRLGLISKTMMTPAAVVAGGMLASEKTRDYAWAVPVVTAVPGIRNELASSINAMKLLKGQGVSRKAVIPIAAANLLKSLIKPGLTSGTIAGINHLREKGEEVNPEEWLVDRG
jgi:hypothetical protein